MNNKKITLLWIFTFVSLSLFAQDLQVKFNEAIQQGDSAFKRTEYIVAIKKYLLAETYKPEKWEIVQEKLDKVYNAINVKLASYESLQKELDQLKKKTQALPNTVSEPTEVVTTKPTTTTVNPPLRKPQPKPLIWNDFLRLYEKPAHQWFLNMGYGFNTIKNNSINIFGSSVGLNFGGRHDVTKKMGVGYQAGIGLGYNSSGSYLHWSIGGKFYPWNCFFISTNYIGGMKTETQIKLHTTNDGGFNYSETVINKSYHGLTLLGGADICFGKNTTDKIGGIVNIAAGAVWVEKMKWGFTMNLGIGLVFRK